MRLIPILLFTNLVLLVGCGQKGPLYLPQPASEAATNEQTKASTDNANQ